MHSTVHHWLLASCLIVAAGCSSSGIFGGRGPKGQSKVEEAFADRDEVGAKSPEEQNSSSLSRKKARSAPADARLDPVERRRLIADMLAVAERQERAGDAATARKAYERVVQLDPGHALANYQLAVIADNEGRFDDAERRYRMLLRKTPRNPDLLASLGWSYLLQRRYEESERALREAVAIDPKHRTALYNLGWLYGTQGDYDHALEAFRTAGSEVEAQQAIAQLFPGGQPANSGRATAGTPRNPFESKGNTATVRSDRAGRSPDRLAEGPISAPAPWQKQGSMDVAADPPSRPSGRPATSQRTKVADQRRDEDLFAEFDARRGNDSPIVQAAATDPSAEATRSGNVPVITPKMPGRSVASQVASDEPVRNVSVAAPPAAKRPADSSRTATPGNSLPDWPYRIDADRASDAASQRQSQAAAAIGLGFSAGSGGMPFPLTPAASP